MQFCLLSLTLAALLSCVANALATGIGLGPRSEENSGADLFTVYQFPNTTWLENIAVRSNGHIIVNLLDRPEMYQVNPFTRPATASLIHRFESYAGLLGVAEITPDIFAVVVGNFSVATLTTTPGSFSVWKVNLRQNPPRIDKIADIVEAELLNGMARLNSHAVMIADSQRGLVYYLDTNTGSYHVAMEDATMKPLPNQVVAIGINGVKIVRGFLYFTNTFAQTLVRVKVDRVTGEAVGPYEVVARNLSPADDFALAEDGTAFVAGVVLNIVTEVSPQGSAKVIAGNLNSTDVAGATSASLGRTPWDRNVVYVATNGGYGSPVNGTFVEGGKVMGIKIHDI
jgi:hypothetical protein